MKACKTRIAVLEEHKAQLSMELVRERKKQNNRAQNMAILKAATQQRNINVTVSTSNYGCFAFGGKSNMSVKVAPALGTARPPRAQNTDADVFSESTRQMYKENRNKS